MPKISVIVPVYKAEKYLDRCIDSILSQTYEDFELVLVDDGSPDRCGEICDNYAAKDNRIKVIHKQNGGVSAARNDGILVANGEYIMFVDSDDYIDITMLEVMYDKISTQQVDAIFTGIRYVFETTGQIIEYNLDSVIIDIPSDINKYYTLLFEKTALAASCSKLFKRSLIIEKGVLFGEGFSILEDGAFTTNYLFECSKIMCLKEVFYNYRQTENDSLMKKFNSNAIDALEYRYNVDKKIIKYLNNKHLKNYYSNMIKCFYRYVVHIYSRSRLFSKEKKEYLKKYLYSNIANVLLNEEYNSELSFKYKIFAFFASKKMICLIHIALSIKFANGLKY